MTPEDVRAAIRAMCAYDHAEGFHDGHNAAGCAECDQRTGQGHWEYRRVNVCSRPEAAFITTVRVWVREPRAMQMLHSLTLAAWRRR
jgi:hypothetical protein